MIQYIYLATKAEKKKVFPQIENYNFICDEVSGLGPVSAQINLAKVGLTDGKVFNSSTLNERNIVLHWTGIGAGDCIADARDQLQESFPPGTKVDVRVKTSRFNTSLTASGYVESIESDYASRNRETGMQMSIICPNPLFISPAANITAAMSYLPSGSEGLLGAYVQGTQTPKPIKLHIYNPAGISFADIVIGFGDYVLEFDAVGGARVSEIEIDGGTKTARRKVPLTGSVWQDITRFINPRAAEWEALQTAMVREYLDVRPTEIDSTTNDFRATIEYGPVEISQNGV